jgi:hypothetical protein
MNNPENILYFDLGFIGFQAEKMQSLFENYSIEPNQDGFYLKFINHNYTANNEGVYAETNCFLHEEHFKEVLFNKLFWSYLYEK